MALRDVVLRANGACASHECLQHLEIAFGVSVHLGIDQRRRVAADHHTGSGTFPFRHALPNLYGDVRHHRVQGPQHRFEHVHQRRFGLLDERGVAAVEGGLADLEVPVAELVPYEAIERARRLIEPVCVETRRRHVERLVKAGKDPPVGQRGWLRAPLRSLRRGVGQTHQRVPRGVPELVGEVSVALDALDRQRNAARLRRVAEQGHTQRVRTVRNEAVRIRRLQVLEACLLRASFLRFGNELLSRRTVDHVERVDDVALDLAHLLAALVRHEACEQHARERHFAHEVKPHHDHARDPEEENVVSGLHVLGRIEAFERDGPVGPAERGKRPEPRAEPGVEHVVVLPDRASATAAASRRILARHGDVLAVVAVPRRNRVPPPELPRDAPVLDVSKPVKVRLGPLRRQDLNRPILDGFDRRRSERLHLHEPLGRDHRLDDRPRPLRTRQRHHVLLAAARETAIAELDLHGLARLEAVEPLERARVLVQRAVAVEDVDLFEAVPFPGGEVVRVVRGSHLHHARPELGIDELGVEDDRNHSIDERMSHVLAMQVPVPRVVRMDRHRSVAEHRLRTRRRDDHLANAVRQRIGEVEHRTLDVFLLLDREVREHRLRVDIPVHQARIAIDEPLFVEPHERLTHGADHVGVHRELRARPVARGAHFAKLLKDSPAGFLLPLPDPLDELLAPEVVPGEPLVLELPLHHDLRRDPGMVDARYPERVVPLHSLVSAQDVLEGGPARMPHVKRPRHVGGRNRQGVGRSVVVGVFRSRKEPGGLPKLVPARLRFGGRILLRHLVGSCAHPTDRVR